MAMINDEYKRIINEIENSISNTEERKKVLAKIDELSNFFVDLHCTISDINENRISEIEKNQEIMAEQINKVDSFMELIKKDIYQDEDFEFEIVCPYCEHEFVADIESELKEEIECPECKNIIELDWDDECGCEGCGGHCEEGCGSDDCGCGGHCHDDDEDDM